MKIQQIRGGIPNNEGVAGIALGMALAPYDDTHWYNQELTRLGIKLLHEAARVNDPEVISVAMDSLSEQLGKLAALLCAEFGCHALIGTVLEGATHNAFEVATLFKRSVDDFDRERDANVNPLWDGERA